MKRKMIVMLDKKNSVVQRLPPIVPIKITSGVDRYGFSSVLAKRCDRRIVLRSFANWVHGWVWHEEPTDELLACSKLPREMTIVVRNEKERRALLDKGFKDVRVGGLPFAYVQRQHDSRHADALLAFPPHSAESSRLTVDQGEYLDYLVSLKNDFEAVYLSIFYQDLNGAMHKSALARGLLVIQGARPDDANSLERVRSILDSFTYVTSNVMGSHMLYALFAGCKFSFCGPIYGYEKNFYLYQGNPQGHSNEYLQKLLELASEPYLRKRFGRFFLDHPHLGIEDVDFANQTIGISSLMESFEIEDALKWNVKGQVKGYVSGAGRRLGRSFRLNRTFK